MNYKKGDIVIVKFPFILKEGSEKQKGRPALVISDDKVKKRYKDIIAMMIANIVGFKREIVWDTGKPIWHPNFKRWKSQSLSVKTSQKFNIEV